MKEKSIASVLATTAQNGGGKGHNISADVIGGSTILGP